MRKAVERECRIRFALAPLWRYAELQLGPEETLSVEEFARRVGTTREKVRYAAKAGIGCYDADAWAVKLDTMPNLIWDEYYDDVLTDMRQEAMAG